MNTNTAIVVVVVVALLGIGGFLYLQSQRQAQRETDPWALIGGGLGMLVTGIAAAATGGDK
ncbi:MAG: hypothetical protein IIA54_00495 [Chloroflexi bacterium]|nr:hypothetical protein [Chloroflexota bacterium]